jgi:hypothetical protein
VSVVEQAPLVASHIFSTPSYEADSSCIPSGENAHAMTPRSWPVNVAKHTPLAASHSFSVLSSDPERNRVPFGENTHALTHP